MRRGSTRSISTTSQRRLNSFRPGSLQARRVCRTRHRCTYHRVTRAGLWATTLAYGLNASREVIPGEVVDLVTHAVLLESNLTTRERHTWFGRIETVGKPGHDLHAHEAPPTVFVVGKAQAGYVRSPARATNRRATMAPAHRPV